MIRVYVADAPECLEGLPEILSKTEVARTTSPLGLNTWTFDITLKPGIDEHEFCDRLHRNPVYSISAYPVDTDREADALARYADDQRRKEQKRKQGRGR